MMILSPSTMWLTGRMAGSAKWVNTTRPRDVLPSSRRDSSRVSASSCLTSVVMAPPHVPPAEAPTVSRRGASATRDQGPGKSTGGPPRGFGPRGRGPRAPRLSLHLGHGGGHPPLGTKVPANRPVVPPAVLVRGPALREAQWSRLVVPNALSDPPPSAGGC